MPCLQKGVDKEKIAKSFPYGKVEVKVVGGGLRWHSGIIATGLRKRSVCDSPAFSPQYTELQNVCCPMAVMYSVCRMSSPLFQGCSST